MKERPILFNAPMVRAIMDGRKTRTRRVVKDKHIDAAPPVAFFQYLREHCPYGQPGDQLWVREAVCLGADQKVLAYRADGEEGWSNCDTVGGYPESCRNNPDCCRTSWQPYRWTPSIHMPRWASRIQLEITGIRVERLQDISEADALAEGIQAYSDGTHRDYNVPDDKVFDHYTFASPVDSYRTLWDTINGPGSWEANPWVWVIEFRRIKP